MSDPRIGEEDGGEALLPIAGEAATPSGEAPTVDDPEQLAAVLRDVRCILLDFDGPVCSVFAGYPAPEVAEHMRSVLRAEGIPLSATGLSTSDPMMVLSDAATLSPEGQSRAEELLQAAEAVCVKTARPTAEAEELLRSAAARNLPVIIVSNNSPGAIRAYLEQQGLTELIREVVGRNAADASLMKPAPHLVHKALSIARCAPKEAVLVGDSVSDVTAGTTAGVSVIAYANKPHKVEPLRIAGADALVTDIQSLDRPCV